MCSIARSVAIPRSERMTDLGRSSGLPADDRSMLVQPVIADRFDHHQAVNVEAQL